MSQSSDLAALIGSRICHDLISPIGAIGNGLELLTMGGAPASPEMALIAESVANANARIRFFRVAFGAGSDGQNQSGAEAAQILADMTQGGRLKVEWLAGDMPRSSAKLAFLLVLCLETAMPYGGIVTVEADGSIRATAQRFKDIPELWAVAGGGAGDVTATHVHFALAAAESARLSRPLSPTFPEGEIALRY